MAFYVLPNRKTVVTYRVVNEPDSRLGVRRAGIALDFPDGAEGFVPDSQIIDRRLFAVHPDDNDLCERADDGTILYRGEAL